MGQTLNEHRVSYIDGELHIECKVCDTIKHHTKYHKNKNNTYGVVYTCKECVTINGKSPNLITADENYSTPARQILKRMGYDIEGDINKQFNERFERWRLRQEKN